MTKIKKFTAFIILICSICIMVSCQSVEIVQNEQVDLAYVFTDSYDNGARVVFDKTGFNYCESYTEKNKGSYYAIFSQNDDILYRGYDSAIELLSKEGENVLFLESKFKNKKGNVTKLKILNMNTLRVHSIPNIKNHEKYDFLLYKNSIYTLKRNKTDLTISQISLKGDIINSTPIKHKNGKMLGIINDRIYYAYSDVNSIDFSVLASCDLAGSNEQDVLSKADVNGYNIYDVSKIRLDGNELYTLVQTKKEGILLKVNMDTGLKKEIMKGSIYNFDIGNHSIFYTNIDGKRVYSLNKNNLNEEPFLNIQASNIVCVNNSVYLEKLFRDYVMLCRVKQNGENFENLYNKYNLR